MRTAKSKGSHRESVSKLWTTDPEYIELLNYFIEITENVESPISVMKTARDFKERSVSSQAVTCLEHRIRKLRTIIHSFEHINRREKVKLMFALSVSVDANFLEELKKEATVEVDDKIRITHYKAIDGSLELRGDHSLSTRTTTGRHESERSLRSLIRSYFENKNIADAVPNDEAEKKIGNLIDFVTEKCKDINSPLNISQFTKDFNKHFGISVGFGLIYRRINAYCREIQKLEILDTHSKVKQLFGLNAKLDPDSLKKLRTEALVEIDEKNRITHYKANDGSLELKGDHSVSTKVKTAHFESKRTCRSLIIGYFKNKNNAHTDIKNEKAEEMGNFIEFITEKCDNLNSPLSMRQMTKAFNNHFGISRSTSCIERRIRRYSREIQYIEFMVPHSKIRQLFGLSVKLDSDYLKELRKNARVEVDKYNRIVEYTANDGSLTLRGSHYGSGMRKPRRIKKIDKDNVSDNSEEQSSDNEGLNDSSDEYASGEFDSDFNSDEEKNLLDETEDLMEQSNEADDFDNETPSRNRSPTEMSIDDNFCFDPPTERSRRSEEIETREDYGRKRKNSSPTPPNEKKRKRGTTGFSSSNGTESFPNGSGKLNEFDNYDTSYSIDDQIKLEPFFGSTHEDLNEIKKDEDVQQIPKSPQAPDEHNQIEEITIKRPYL